MDVYPRALEYTQFNAQLNGIANVEFRRGDLFAPVDGLTFDIDRDRSAICDFARAIAYGGIVLHDRVKECNAGRAQTNCGMRLLTDVRRGPGANYCARRSSSAHSTTIR